jgi:hypothetical protein
LHSAIRSANDIGWGGTGVLRSFALASCAERKAVCASALALQSQSLRACSSSESFLHPK